jgi:hypothetical protein
VYRFPDLRRKGIELDEVRFWNQWRPREAITYVRDGDFKAADIAFQAIADYANTKKMSQVEADTCRQIALHQPYSHQALLYLSKSESVLHEGNNAMLGVNQQELAQKIARRVELSIKL